MSRYEGLNSRLKQAVLDRDGFRCRWCGATNRSLDAHHIRYRRGNADDVIENLISLCRICHGSVHGIKTGSGRVINKQVAQEILYTLIESPGSTGLALWRHKQRQWVREGRCEQHGMKKDECLEC